MPVTANAYNPLLRAVRNDPYAVLNELRSHGSILWHDHLNMWFVVGYEQGRALLTSKELQQNLSELQLRNARSSVASDSLHAVSTVLSEWLFFSNPPYQTKLRNILNPYLSREVVDDKADFITEQVKYLLKNQKSTVHVLNDLAKPLTMTVMLSLLGLPQNNLKNLIRWIDAVGEVVNALVITPDIIESANSAITDAKKYLQPLINDALSGTTPNKMIQSIYKAMSEDDLLPEDSTWNMLLMLLTAGYETTSHLISNAVLVLLQHPEQLKKLRQRPELIDSAVDEILRYSPSVQGVYRQAVADIKAGNVTIKKDDFVYVSLLAMNHDPGAFEQPDKFDIERSPNHHVAFGHGIHYCMGRLLAKKITLVFIGTLLDVYNDIQLSADEIQWDAGFTLRRLKGLQIEVGV